MSLSRQQVEKGHRKVRYKYLKFEADVSLGGLQVLLKLNVVSTKQEKYLMKWVENITEIL